MVQGLLQASELVNEKDLKFVKERYFEGEKSIFEPISKFSIKTGSDKEKPQKKKIITVLKENKPAFGVIVTKATDLHEALYALSHHCH